MLGSRETPHLREMFKDFHGKSLTTPSILSQPGTGKGWSASSILNHTDTDGWAGITSSRVVSAVPPGVPLLPALQGLVPTLARSAGLGFETPVGNPGHTGGVLCIAQALHGQMDSRGIIPEDLQRDVTSKWILWTPAQILELCWTGTGRGSKRESFKEIG